MNRHQVQLVIFSVAFAASRLAAQETPVIRFDEALRMFAKNNLELQVARSRADQAAGLARQAGAFPNPSINASHEPLSGAARSYSETYLTASQRLEVSGSRGARLDAAGQRSEAMYLRARADSLRIGFEVKRAYVQALRAQVTRATTERIAGVFRAALRSASERYASDDISLYALRRIGIESARYETILADADLEMGSAQRTLATLIDPSGHQARYAAGPLPTEIPPAVSQATLDAAGAEARAELAAARAELEAEHANARLMRAERIPDITATGGFKRQSDGLRGAFLGFSLPVPLLDRRAGSIAAGDASVRTADARLALTRRQLENDVQQTVDTYRTLQRRLEIGFRGSRDGDDLLDIALVAYDEGEMDLVELLDAADAVHEARAAEARLRAAAWIAYFDLERALGGFDASSPPEDAR